MLSKSSGLFQRYIVRFVYAYVPQRTDGVYVRHTCTSQVGGTEVMTEINLPPPSPQTTLVNTARPQDDEISSRHA